MRHIKGSFITSQLGAYTRGLHKGNARLKSASLEHRARLKLSRINCKVMYNTLCRIVALLNIGEFNIVRELSSYEYDRQIKI